MTIGEYIRKKRDEKRFTRREVAKKAGISVMDLYRIETGKRKRFNIETIIKIANVIGVPIVELMTETGLVEKKKGEKWIFEDPVFIDVLIELYKTKDLSETDKKRLANILVKVIKSFQE
jgi:transcriptional regulator with XRE-family HTH domain